MSLATSSNTVVSAETAYPISMPSARVRVVGFVEHLAAHGVDLLYEPTLTDREYAVVASNASPFRKAAVLGRAATRLLRRREPATLRMVHRLRFLAPVPRLEPLAHVDVYDFDDALFLGSVASSNPTFAWAKRESARSIQYMRRARLVIAGNAYLADGARAWAASVEVVPSCINAQGHVLREHEDAPLLTVGWIGSRPTSRYLGPLLPVIDRMNERGIPTRLLLVGGDTSISAPWIEHRPWSLDAERLALAEIDIGVMPMPDDAWARGKCGYKLLQYFAAGVPAVASPVGVAVSMIGDDRGLLAGSADSWLDSLSMLGRDAKLRRDFGRQARSFVEREYSYQRWAPELARMLHELDNG